MSLAFYNQFPERVDSLIIIDTGPGFKNEDARNNWNNYAISTAEKFELSGLDSLTGRSKEMDPKNHLNAKGLSKAARGMLTQHDDRIIRSLEKISVPSLIIVGENDEPFLAASDYMERKIVGSKKVVISHDIIWGVNEIHSRLHNNNGFKSMVHLYAYFSVKLYCVFDY